MSALHPIATTKADMCGARGHVRYGPIADISQLSAGLSINPNWRPGTSAFGLKASMARRMTAPNPLRGLVFRHCDHGAGEGAVGLSQFIQNREVISVRDRYQVAWDMSLRPVGMVIAAARDHGRQLAGAVGDTQ